MTDLLQLFLGLAILIGGAQLLVRGAVALALRLGLTPLVIGLTIVAFGTSAPELVVSLQAIGREAAEIAVGNVIGSNLCNLALILGICALIKPLTTSRIIIKREIPLLVAATFLAALVMSDGYFSVMEGAALLAGLLIYTGVTLRQARRNLEPSLGQEILVSFPLSRALVYTGAGLLLLLFGADMLVDGAILLARQWGWSETVIGLTIVAIGTSLPELAISIVAAYKGQTDMAIGNVVGSSLFNLLGILGATGLAGSGILLALRPADWILLVVLTMALWPLVISGQRLDRGEGAALLITYLAYTGWLMATRV